MKRCLAFLLLGVIVGASVINILNGKKMDRIYWDNEELKVQLFESTERLKRLEAQLETRHKSVIKEIKIELENSKGSFEELSLRQSLGELARDLVGEELDSLSPTMVHSLFHDRHVKLENQQLYHIRVKWIIISTQTIIHLDYEPVNGSA